MGILSEFLEKLADIVLPAILAFILIFFAFGEASLKVIKVTKEHNESISKLESDLQLIKSDLSKYIDVATKLTGSDNTELVIEQNKVKKLAQENSKLIGDINGIVINDPKKIIALERVNDKLNSITKELSSIKSDVSKNDDRIFSGISNWITILLFALTLILSLAVKLLLPNKKES
jgi:hypothetical protein